MNTIKKYFRLPELLLLLVIPTGVFLRGQATFDIPVKDTYYVFDGGILFQFFGLLLIFSWVIHLQLRKSSNFPNIASWIQALLTIVCWLFLLFINHQLKFDTPKYGSKFNPDNILNALLLSSQAALAIFILFATQVIFWIAGLQILWKRGRLRKRSTHGT